MLETDPRRVCELLVGLPDVNVLGVDDPGDGLPLRLWVESRFQRPGCPGCGQAAWVKDRPTVELVDLPCFGRPVRLVWRKHRWFCPDEDCPGGSFTREDTRIAWPRAGITDRAGRWATWQVGGAGRAVSDVAKELGCDWHTVNDAVMAYGAALVDDPARIGPAEAVGLDETLFCRLGPWHAQHWSTSIVDVTPGVTAQLLDMAPGRTAGAASAWLDARPVDWLAAVRYGVLDLSGPFRKAFGDSLGHATLVADPFHVVKVANTKLDECRRRVQNETLGHRGRKDDPLYRARRLLTKAHERLDDKGETKLLGLLAAGDPHGDVRTSWHAKEVVRSIYDITDPDLADEFVTQLASDLQDRSCPPEVNSLGRTLARWHDEIVNWHKASVSNGPTEAINNLIKRIKRAGFGFRRFSHYRIRALLYAGKPNWDLLPTITPR